MLLPEPIQQAAQLSHQVKRQREQGHFHALPRSAHLVPDGLDGGWIEVEAHREARPFGQGKLMQREQGAADTRFDFDRRSRGLRRSGDLLALGTLTLLKLDSTR